MYARVGGSELKSKLGILANGKDAVINVKILNDTLLSLQAYLSGIVEEEFVELKDSDKGTADNASVMVDSSFNLLEDEMDVELTLEKNILIVKQGAFEAYWAVAPDERLDIPLLPGTLKDFPSVDFLQIASALTSLEPVAKILLTETAPLVIKNGQVYIYYWNIFYRNKINLPDMTVTGMLTKDLSRIIRTKKSCRYMSNEGSLQIFGSDNSRINCLTRSTAGVTEGALDNIISELSSVVTLDMLKQKSLLATIVKTYKQATIDVIVTSEGLQFYINQPNSKVTVGEAGTKILGIRIPIQILGVITRVFGDYSGVEIITDMQRFLGFKYGAKILIMSGNVLRY